MQSAAFFLAQLLFTKLAFSGIPVVETPLGSEADYDAIKRLTVSDDYRHLVFLGVKGDKQYVVRDGVAGPAYDWVIPDSISAPSNLSHLGFAFQVGDDVSVMIDGKIVGHGYYGIGGDRILFSGDGMHYAYRARRGTRQTGDFVMVRDGVEGKPYQASQPVPRFSPDGNHLLYVAAPAQMKSCLVVDEKEGPTLEAISAPSAIFSPDSRRNACAAVSGGKYLAVIDGKPGASYSTMLMPPIFSPDSQHLAYVAGNGNQLSVVLDGIAGPPFESFTDGSVLFSPDSKHLAYVARSAKQWQVILDGKLQQSFDLIAGESILFSPDSSHLAYVAIKNNKRVVILDGKEQSGPYDNVLWSASVFSPDGKHMAYAGVGADHVRVVLDGKEGPPYDAIALVAFSPDSRHLTYNAVSNRHIVVVIDGKESPPLDNVTPLTYSPDSAHYAYAARASNQAKLVIDGVDADKTYSKWINGTFPTFDAQGRVDFLMNRNGQFLQIRAQLPTAPATTPSS
jgi:hypothetical protein